jgi:hypothetical protein
MRRQLFRLLIALVLLGLAGGAAHAQTAPQAAPPWERWFDALNAGDVAGVVALMRAEVEEGDVIRWRCAGGCLGMAEIEAGVARLVADGYWGEIDPASVAVVGAMVSFDVATSAAATPFSSVTTRWMMELDGDLLAPACEGICLRHPAAPVGTLSPAAAAPPIIPAALAPRVAVTPSPASAAPGGVAGRTPAPWLLIGIAVGLLFMVASAGIGGWREMRRRLADVP